MQTLKDPKKDRQVNIPPPVITLLNSKMLFDTPHQSKAKTGIRISSLRDHFLREGRLTNECMVRLIKEAARIFQKEPNLLVLSEPLVVVGDIHGQFQDLLQVFGLGGKVSETKYLFLGDYVDRGEMSVEVMALLLAQKIQHPNNIYLLRGNHETESMSSSYSFRQECLIKHNQQVYQAFVDLFKTLPVAAVINEKYFAIHAGISPELKRLEQIDEINRFQEPPDSGLLWLAH
jgi:serine/threonine-protein phosphatase 2B catalytic subunit